MEVEAPVGCGDEKEHQLFSASASRLPRTAGTLSTHHCAIQRSEQLCSKQYCEHVPNHGPVRFCSKKHKQHQKHVKHSYCYHWRWKARIYRGSLCVCWWKKASHPDHLQRKEWCSGERGTSHSSIPRQCSVTASTNGWMTKESLLRWIQDIWSEAEDGECQLLVLDHYKPHRTADTGSLIQS